MLDFLLISTRSRQRGVLEIYPKFIIKKSKDLMIRGGDFYAIWIEGKKLWSTDEEDALQLIDQELDIFAKENKDKFDSHTKVLHMWDSETGMIDSWHKYCQKQMRDSFHMLDEKIIFLNDVTKKEDYASKKLNYPLEKCPTPAYDKLMSTLYSDAERKKIEWAIGAVVSGDSKKIQKFLVLYGAAGTGKSTVLNIIQQLFDGYYSVFDAKALGSTNNTFALEAFKANPLVAIQHDGDLSRIEDNTRLNSLVSHELMTVNEKFKSTYANRFKCFLFMGTNKPVKITDAKSGLIRRLIDVSPSGNKLDSREYKKVIGQIKFELGGIASHCYDLYLSNPGMYDDYVPISMLGASNDFYNFVMDSYNIFSKENGTSLKAAWEMYKTYCDEAKVSFPLPQRLFKEELKNYFREYRERYSADDGTRVRSYYMGFRADKFDEKVENDIPESQFQTISFDFTDSIFDEYCKDLPAQYASANETPKKEWSKVNTTLKDLDTSKLHYVKLPENHIVIDFDIRDSTGKKVPELNYVEASKWPPTYGELSKGGGLHLHYIYNGDVTKVSRVYSDSIEIKIFTGNSSLRRKLTKCNNLPIATISSGLPMKGENKVVNFEGIKNEKGIRTSIKRNLNKEIHPATKPSIDFIYKILEDAYSSNVKYDVSDMRNAVLAFAANSTNNADYCIKLVNKMKFKSDDISDNVKNDDAELVFYDVEVFPNLFIVNWKLRGKENPVVRMINPTPLEIETLMKFRLVGFNCRRYDNHILYARLMGYNEEQLYNLSSKIINSAERGSNYLFGEAYNISYTDIYDFASAGNKKSLKKLEVEMGIHHQELGLPWDKPVPKEQWVKVAEYCDNDVIATEAAFDYLSADWTARQILADLAGLSVNDTTNTLTTKIIFGSERKPQSEFQYRNLAEPVYKLNSDVLAFLKDACPEMMKHKHGEKKSLLPYFDGYSFEGGKSLYKGEEVGEGGYVYAEPGMYTNVALLDIASMHPHSVIAECLFGPRFTKAFKEIVDGRVSIKHEAWQEVNNMLNGKLTPYIQKVINGELTAKQLADALKTAINSVYGLTSASFDNPFRDIRNVDNIVAKRGALFMIDLKEAVQQRGFTVAHIKTDSIKIPNATKEIIDFVIEFGKRYGYSFEHEATYERMCLVNDAVYIARYKDGKHAGEWTATGKQFAVPYLFKKLFSKEQIVFSDMCETFEVKKGDLYLDMNESLPDVSQYENELDKALASYKKEKITEQQYIDIKDKLEPKIAKGHNMHFIGRVGQFTPMRSGSNAGILYRVNNDRKYAAAGSTGYRWMESEMVKQLHKEEDIDISFYEKLINDAVDTISSYGDFEWFVSNDTDDISNSAVPYWHPPCSDVSGVDCDTCEHFSCDDFHFDCDLGYDISELINLKSKKKGDKIKND
ncbi:MAG: DUF5906 domain-containing protein [Clostridia bacterium]|nr:DUF5906 domain-containing protein [Clostridia bacterium]